MQNGFHCTYFHEITLPQLCRISLRFVKVRTVYRELVLVGFSVNKPNDTVMKNTSRRFHFPIAVQSIPHSGQGKQLEFQRQLFSFTYCPPFIFLPVTFAIILLVLSSGGEGGTLRGSGLLADCSNVSKRPVNGPSNATFNEYQNTHNYRLL